MSHHLIGAMVIAQGWLWPGLFYVGMSKATGSWKLT
jgi:hypothetical protein